MMEINDQIIKDIIKNKDLKNLMHETLTKVDKYDNIIDESRCQFNQTDDYGKLSVLGFINGILPELTGKVLVEKYNEENSSSSYDIVDKWW